MDEAAWLFVSLDSACHAQLMAEAAAANGIPKRIIPDEVAQYTADAAQNAVRYTYPHILVMASSASKGF